MDQVLDLIPLNGKTRVGVADPLVSEAHHYYEHMDELCLQELIAIDTYGIDY